ncbi:putative non-specific lipid-transfer protein 14 [Olea europaea var. sylvestris]|uniref:Non-specific lipid-transfer 14 n=1 Tax=Olea europaea subsp. europaea TaxID=158383 RepID=A0A8S0T9I1_OLEEU|nr:putative non-specific lipid-transfer protein 14 [Olea europaea var. sylvestris]CAA3001688.1 non-specific lipid-transfer 14 [Olea europaea subsp. europaea]
MKSNTNTTVRGIGIVILFSQYAFLSATAADCSTVTALVSSCSSFIASGSLDSFLGSPCCVAMTSLSNLADPGYNRRAVCWCLMELITTNNLNAPAIAALPGLCGVSLGFTIDPYTDCQ